MRATFVVPVVLGLLLAPCLRSDADQAAVPVKNPSFEDALANGSPAAWTANVEVHGEHGAMRDGRTIYQLDDSVAHTGKRSLRFSNQDPTLRTYNFQPIDLKPGQAYEFSVWVKTKGLQGDSPGATIAIDYFSKRGYLGGTYAPGIKGDNDWTLVRDRAVVPAGVTGCILHVFVTPHMTGTAWFDDVSVRPISTAGFTDPLAGKTVGQARPGGKSLQWQPACVTFLDPMAWIKYTKPDQQIPAMGSISFDLRIAKGFTEGAVLSDALEDAHGMTTVGFTLRASRQDDAHYVLYFGHGSNKAPNGWCSVHPEQPLEAGRWYSIALSWGSKGMTIFVDGEQAARSGLALPYERAGGLTPLDWGLGAVFNRKEAHAVDPSPDLGSCCMMSLRKLRVSSEQIAPQAFAARPKATLGPATPSGFDDPLIHYTVGVRRPQDSYYLWHDDATSLVRTTSWIKYTDPSEQLFADSGTLMFCLFVDNGYNPGGLLISDACPKADGTTSPSFTVKQLAAADAKHFKLAFSLRSDHVAGNWSTIVSKDAYDTHHWITVAVTWGPKGQNLWVNGKLAAHSDFASPRRSESGKPAVCWGLGSVFNKTAANSDDPDAADPSAKPVAFCHVELRLGQMENANQPVPW